MNTQLEYAPQIGFPEGKPYRAGINKKTRKASGYGVEEYLRLHADRIKREQEQLRTLTEKSVELRIRYRGVTVSDLCSVYGTRRTTQGRFLEWDTDLDGDIHPINIVQPTFSANKSACLQANSQNELSSANASAKNKNLVIKWQKVADFLERTSWTESERAIIFDAVQCDGTMLIEIEEKQIGEREAKKPRKENSFIAEYNCERCGERGAKVHDFQKEDAPDEQTGEIECPKCGGGAEASIKRYDAYALEAQNISEVEISHKLIPFYNFAIDRYGAKLGGIKTAKWLQIHDLFDRAELEAQYPDFEFGSPMEWCFQNRVSFGLSDNDWAWLNYMPMFSRTASEFDRFEKRDIYLYESLYANYVCPEDYEFINSCGEKTFSIREGQTFSEACGGAEGFKYAWIGERLLDIYSPEKEETCFRRRFADVHWRRDSSSYYSSPNYSVKILQDDITQLNTMNHNIIARNTVNQVYYRSDVFKQSDFSGEYIGTDNAMLMENGDISKAITSLPIPTPSPFLSNQLQFLWQVKDSVTQVQPAMRGEAQKGETFSATRQQLEQSYGLLTDVLKSFAKCKVDVLKHKLRIVQKKWTLEQFQTVASNFGEIWTDADVREMCALNFEKDVLIDYRQGSEMPVSDLMREMKFTNGLAQLGAVVEMAASGVPLPIDKLMQKVDEFAEFDFDTSGLEVAEMLSQKRIIELQLLCREHTFDLEQIEEMRNTVVQMDEQGQPISALDLALEELFYHSTIRFNQYENLEQQAKAFIEALNSESAKAEPNYLFIELLMTVLGMLEEAGRQMQLEAMEKDPSVQMEREMAEKATAEQIAAEAASAEQAKQAELEKQAQSAQIEGEKAAVEREQQNADKQEDFALRTLEAEATHERAKELAEISAKEKNKEAKTKKK